RYSTKPLCGIFPRRFWWGNKVSWKYSRYERNLLEFLLVLFYLPRLAWRRVSGHLFRWTQLAHMTDSALDQLEGQPGLLEIWRRLRAAKSMIHLSGRAFLGSQRSSFSSR